MRRLLTLWLAGLPLFGQTPSPNIQTFFKQAFEQRLREEPEFATAVGRHEYDDRWTDWSKNAREQRRSHLQEELQTLKSFPSASLEGQDRLSAVLMDYDHRLQLEAFDLRDELFAVLQQNGLHNRVYTTVDRMPARTLHDYENLLARLRAVPAYVDQAIALLETAVGQHVMQPRIVVDLVSAQLAVQIAQTRDNTPLLAAFRRFPSGISQTDQARLRAQAAQIYEQQFLPAWRKYRGYIAGTYAQNSRATIGVNGIPSGSARYRTLVRLFTTTSTTPEQIHQIGLDEVKRIEREMQAMMREAGFKGSIAEYERQLDTAPGQHFRSKDEMLAFCRNVAKIVEPELPNQFKHIPMLLYGIRPIPEDREQASATNAQAPSPDYTAPGWMNLNTYQPEKQVKYDKEALVLHEAVPGHVLQLSLAEALSGLPEFRKFYSNSAYVEGWALYAESLGSQLGVYRDPASHFGQLASERFRAVRLVVDTGLHAMGWTREQAIEYFKTNAPTESLAEVDRYISWPGQALAYKMGQLKIAQLRTEAEQKLGARFDIREFHDLVLRNGVLPLELLQQQVETWLRAAR